MPMSQYAQQLYKLLADLPETVVKELNDDNFLINIKISEDINTVMGGSVGSLDSCVLVLSSPPNEDAAITVDEDTEFVQAELWIGDQNGGLWLDRTLGRDDLLLEEQARIIRDEINEVIEGGVMSYGGTDVDVDERENAWVVQYGLISDTEGWRFLSPSSRDPQDMSDAIKDVQDVFSDIRDEVNRLKQGFVRVTQMVKDLDKLPVVSEDE